MDNLDATTRPCWRFRHALDDTMCDPLFGLMRVGVVRQTHLYGAFADSDRVLLAEMALRGRFILIPEYLFSRRLHAQATTTKYRDVRQRTLVFDPSKTGKLIFPTFQKATALSSSIHSAGLPLKER